MKLAAKSHRKQTRFVGLFQTGLGIKSVILFAILFSLFTIHYSLFTKEVHAQCTVPENAKDQQIINQFNKCAISENIYDDKIFNFNQIAGTIDSLNTHILGVSALHPETDKLTQRRGALAVTSNLVAGLYGNPPASGVEYFAQQIQKFNPVQPAYAQGIGFKALSPVQELWKVFRNASYVGFVIIFVIMGFMIMFRSHISPQAVATVQDSLPRIVIALVLVTFSYALAGLMIDIMFVVINVFINLLAQSGLIDQTTANKVIFDKSIFGVIVGGWTDIFETTANAIHKILDDVINFGGSATSLLTWGIGGIAGLIVGIGALIIMVRIALMLLIAYVTIILLTLFAPFFFLVQALPGNNGAKEWFKQMAANVAVFPTVALMIILAGVVGGITAFGGTGLGELGGDQSPALKFPLLVGGLDPNAIGKIIAIGFLFITPQAAELARNVLGVKGGPNFGAAVGAGLAAGAAPVGAFGRKAYGAAIANSPVGNYFKTREAMRNEIASLKARKSIGINPPGGLTKTDLEKYGIGYK